MKKLLCILLVFGMAVSFAFAGGGKDKGADKIVCGITEFEPMNYRNASGNWTGFETEFAQAVGEKLGLKIEFQLIDWGNKFIELNSKSIDAIWNGFTGNANESDGTPRSSLCDMSYSYMTNQQCVVVKAERAGEFKSAGALAGKTIAAEAGSAGEAAAKDLIGGNGKIIGVPVQINSFLEVKSGASDGAVIDIILAQQIAGSGDYADLVIADITLEGEVYAVGFRKGDALRDKVNKAMAELFDEGKVQQIAKKYGLENNLLLNRNFGK